LTLLGLYRILSCTPKVKLGSIVEEFTGDSSKLTDHQLHAQNSKDGNPFKNLKGSYRLDTVTDIASKLVPSGLKKLSTAGPNANPSFLGLFVDARTILDTKMVEHMRNYLRTIGKAGEQKSPFIDSPSTLGDKFLEKLRQASHIYNNTVNAGLTFSNNQTFELGKLAFKEEAAGKIRVFAIVDS
jgi:hypothetical protein